VYTPSRGSIEREGILDRVREQAIRTTKEYVIFHSVKIKIKDNWALMSAQMRDKKGNPLYAFSRTKNSKVAALLFWRAGAWEMRVFDTPAGSDKEIVDDFPEGYDAPAELFTAFLKDK